MASLFRDTDTLQSQTHWTFPYVACHIAPLLPSRSIEPPTAQSMKRFRGAAALDGDEEKQKRSERRLNNSTGVSDPLPDSPRLPAIDDQSVTIRHAGYLQISKGDNCFGLADCVCHATCQEHATDSTV